MKFAAVTLAALTLARRADAHDPAALGLLRDHAAKVRDVVDAVGGVHRAAALAAAGRANAWRRSGDGRRLSPSRALADAAVEAGHADAAARILQDADQAVTCTILSIAIENTKYESVRPLSEYDESVVCLEEGRCEDDLPEIKFVSHDADAGEFLYQDRGPASMQGVHWLNLKEADQSASGYCSTILSFAETREDFPLSTGRLREPISSLLPFFPPTADLPDLPIPGTNDTVPGTGVPGYPVGPSLGLYSGLTYEIRAHGDSVWAYAGTDECFLVTDLDIIYGHKLLEGTLEEPKRFLYVPSYKIFPAPLDSIRVTTDDDCVQQDTAGTAYADIVYSFRFEITLVEDCTEIDPEDTTALGNNTWALAACEAGSIVWRRDSWAQTLRSGPPNSYYYTMQVVDGCGNKIQPAYNFLLEEMGKTPQPYVNAFRTLKKSSRTENEKCDHTPKKSKTSKKSSKGSKASKKS